MPARLSGWISIVACACLYLVFIARTRFYVDGTLHFSLFDDAMVSMRYARNLADGHGLVWNPGDTPVEGYTNFLWTLWMAALHLAPIPERYVSLGVMLSGMVILLLNVVVSGRIATHLAPEAEIAGPVAMWLVGLYYPLIYWTLRGMEVGLISLLIGIVTLFALRLHARYDARDVAIVAAVMIALILTRSDALIPGVIVALFAVATMRATARQRWTAALVFGGVAVGTLGLHVLARTIYYGQTLPNTYYLKLEGIDLSARLKRGFDVLIELARHHLYAPLCIAGLLLVSRRLRGHPGLYLLAALVLAQTAYSVYVGGDAWEWMGYSNRFIAPAVSSLLILSSVGISVAVEWAWRARHPVLGRPFFLPAMALPILVLVTMNGDPLQHWIDHNAYHVEDDAAAARYGIVLRRVTAPDASIAVVWAGAIPYFSHRHSIDLLGKSDSVVAHGEPQFEELGTADNTIMYPGHNKWNYPYSIGRLRPDLIAQLWAVTDQTREQIGSWGYVKIDRKVYVRADSTLVDRDQLRRYLVTTTYYVPDAR